MNLASSRGRTLRIMTTWDTLESFTTDKLTLAKALDFARLTGLQAKYRGLPDPSWYALRNFSHEFPRAIHADLLQKAAVAVGSTTDSTWAGPLGAATPLKQGFIQLVRSSTVLGELNIRRVPMQVSMPVETGGATFTWVGENAPKRLSAGAFSTLSLLTAKAAGLIAVADEVVRFEQPGNDVSFRDVLVKGMGVFVETEMFDQAIASSATRPGGLANGSPTAAATGVTPAACASDIKTAINAFVAVNPSLEDARIVMSPNSAIAVAAAMGSTTLLATGGSLSGIPVYTTAAIGNKILIFDASQAVYGDDPAGVRIDVSREASAMLDSAPSDPTVATDVFTSFWQRDLVGFKCEYPIRWKLARTDAARVITGVAYA